MPTGYDGNGYGLGDRVELHPGLDLWMQGARYGVVTRVGREIVTVRLDRVPRRRFRFAPDRLRHVASPDQGLAPIDLYSREEREFGERLRSAAARGLL